MGKAKRTRARVPKESPYGNEDSVSCDVIVEETIGQQKFRHRQEHRTLQGRVALLRQQRNKLNKRDNQGKKDRKVISNEIKALTNALEERHARERAALAEARGPQTSQQQPQGPESGLLSTDIQTEHSTCPELSCDSSAMILG
eukprot:gnl/Spiro4/15592_TR8384_c0_g1_i1.p1 gnl/Spiro4/15592_TR8384_c0_g1~~gnl/Spiro4/15592_TR8384_c0_g1_i1.p1  ORF type:complete len:153 (+),score=17.34 gnl/Spiro4/15592_TR8384_c0_g1_i1:31-459(+)